MITSAPPLTDPISAGAGLDADVYARLGVARFINASGHNTVQGGSLMPPDVLDAMQQAAGAYVSLPALQQAAGKRIAEVIGVPAAIVTSGAAGAILLGTAAALTGTDQARIWALPETLPGGRDEVLVWRSRRPNYMYQAAQAAGARLVELGQPDAPIRPEQFRDGLSGRTAAVLLVLAHLDEGRAHTGGWEPFLQAVAGHAAGAGVPVLVDAASELPPRDLVGRLLRLGASGVIVSGGKAIRGPQSSGLLLGTRELIAAAELNNNPRAAIGRPMKVGKEEICGLVAAVERFFGMDEAAQLADWRATCEAIAAAAASLPGVTAEVIQGHPDYGRPPAAAKAVLSFRDGAAAADALDQQLRAGAPAVSALRRGSNLIFNPMTIEPGETEQVVAALRRCGAAG